MDYRKVEATQSVNKDLFPFEHHKSSSFKRLYTIFSWQILNARAYLRRVFDSYRFFPVGKSASLPGTNAEGRFESPDGASDSDLIRLAESFGITEDTYSRILFEWESKFTPKTTEDGIEDFIRLFFKHDLINRMVGEERAELISKQMHVSIKSWYDMEITENDNVYSFDDNEVFTLYLELVIPPAYARHLINLKPKTDALMVVLKNVVVPTAKIKFLEVSWR